MATPRYEALIEFLEPRFGEQLRWVASFNSARFAYTVRYIRPDLEVELSSLELETIIHRSMAVFNRQHVEDVYFHLGDAEALVVQHDRAFAVHIYLTDTVGVVIKLERDATVTIPTFVEECLDRLGVDQHESGGAT